NFGGTKPNGDLGANLGWDQRTTPRYLADMNGDGKLDLVAFGEAGVYVANGNGGGGDPFGPLYLAYQSFGSDQGWAGRPEYLRWLGDLNGDGLLDLIGFGENFTYYALNATPVRGAAASFAPVQTMLQPQNMIPTLAYQQGWNNEDYFRGVADVN